MAQLLVVDVVATNYAKMGFMIRSLEGRSGHKDQQVYGSGLQKLRRMFTSMQHIHASEISGDLVAPMGRTVVGYSF